MAVSVKEAEEFGERVVERKGAGFAGELLEILREPGSNNKSVQVSFDRLAEALERAIKRRS